MKPNNKYLSIPPKIVIEIDTKAEIKDFNDSIGYYHKKTDNLLEFGVEKVIWFFTDSKKIMTATTNSPWETANWSENIELLEGIVVNVEKIIGEY